VAWRSSLRLCLTLGFWLALAGSSAAQVFERFRDWQLVRTEGACQIISMIRSESSGAMLLEARMLPIATDTGGLMIALRVPIGVDLASGIGLRHMGSDRVAIGLDWLSCDPSMCTAGGQLSEMAVARLRRDNSVFIGFRPTRTARPVNLELSLMGFSAASRALGNCAAD